MYQIILDVYESADFKSYLERTLHVDQVNMVSTGMADITWYTDHSITLEHKTAHSVLMEMGKRLDDQLRKHTNHATEVGLVINGLLTPVPGMRACYVWQQTNTKEWFHIVQKKNRQTNQWEPFIIHRSWEEYQAYLWSLDKEGITVYQAPTLETLASAISAFVHNSHKPEHRTLRRYVKTKPILWKPDPYVETLMGVSGSNIGEVTAKDILSKYDTPYNAFLATKSNWRLSSNLYNRLMGGIGKL